MEAYGTCRSTEDHALSFGYRPSGTGQGKGKVRKGGCAVQLTMLRRKVIRQSKLTGYPSPVVGDYFNTFYNSHLPFPLTGAQKRVVKEIRRDVATGYQMNRLVQGDVGSGRGLWSPGVDVDVNCA